MINKVFTALNFLLASKETLEQQDKEFSLSGIKELKEEFHFIVGFDLITH
ncbi:hypothetical protein VN0264_11160 [Helicobacter pylori]|nr:hypothetical protein VN0264_11160 [Helicobacter pylori]